METVCNRFRQPIKLPNTVGNRFRQPLMETVCNHHQIQVVLIISQEIYIFYNYLTISNLPNISCIIPSQLN
jgi:hypothetical protein